MNPEEAPTARFRARTYRLIASRWPTILLAARLMRSASATEVPPNFMTMVGLWAVFPSSEGTVAKGRG